MTVEVVVDLASLDTGIDMRNQHMRENHLHTDRYPQAIFRGATFVGEHPASLAPGKTAKCKIAGSFSLHGVTRRIEVPIELRLDEKSGGLAVKAQFVVYLADYEIPRPKMLFVKLDEKQAVTFEALALPK